MGSKLKFYFEVAMYIIGHILLLSFSLFVIYKFLPVICNVAVGNVK